MQTGNQEFLTLFSICFGVPVRDFLTIFRRNAGVNSFEYLEPLVSGGQIIWLELPVYFCEIRSEFPGQTLGKVCHCLAFTT